MTFIQGSYDAPTILSTIVQALVATDDFTTYDEELTDGYCIKHTPTSTYIMFKCQYPIYIGSSSSPFTVPNGGHSVGIRVVFSTDWDLSNHIPAGTLNCGAIPFYNTSYGVDKIVSPYVFSVSMWVDKFGWQMCIQNNYSYGVGIFSTCEFFPSTWPEYDDTAKPIVFYTRKTSDWWNSRYPLAPGENATQTYEGNGGYLYVRPFRFSMSTFAAGNEGSYLERKAYKSEGNNKIYFEFPWYENDVPAARKPYAQTRRWFEVDITGGFSIGDILNWIDPDEVTVHKYIVAVVTAGQRYYAIPYENAFDYTTGAKQ